MHDQAPGIAFPKQAAPGASEPGETPRCSGACSEHNRRRCHLRAARIRDPPGAWVRRVLYRWRRGEQRHDQHESRQSHSGRLFSLAGASCLWGRYSVTFSILTASIQIGPALPPLHAQSML